MASTPSGYNSPAPEEQQDPLLVRFSRSYGWRAYVIPVLLIISIWLIVDVARSAGTSEAQDAPASEETHTAAQDEDTTGVAPRGAGPDPAESPEEPNIPSELPPGGPFTAAGEGTFRAVGQPGMVAGEGREGTVRYVVEVENGLNTDTYGGDNAVAAMVDATLSDPRGWTNDPGFRFEHVGPEDNPDLRIRIASPVTTAELCGRYLEMETSCRTMITGESTVMLNESRWVRGADPFQGDLGSYRQYLINHEVGHALGYRSHQACSAEGELAPVMMQQTLSLNNSELLEIAPYEIYPDDNLTCRYNPWPYPTPGIAPTDEGGPGEPEEDIF